MRPKMLKFHPNLRRSLKYSIVTTSYTEFQFSCLALHIILRVSQNKLYVSKQTVSSLHLMRLWQLRKVHVVYA